MNWDWGNELRLVKMNQVGIGENELGLGKMIWDGENNLDWGK
jgi:hypothetical protein